MTSSEIVVIVPSSMTMLEIKPGERYVVVNPVDGTELAITTIEPAKWVLEHWSCLTDEGKKLLVGPDDFLRPLGTGE